MMLTRQGLDAIERSGDFDPYDVWRGGYVVQEDTDPAVCLMASGSEVALACNVAKVLQAQGTKTKVISVPSVNLLRKQDRSYRAQLLPENVLKVSIEAGVSTPWREFVGTNGVCIGIDRFGASAPAEVLAQQFGFTVNSVVQQINHALGDVLGESH